MYECTSINVHTWSDWRPGLISRCIIEALTLIKASMCGTRLMLLLQSELFLNDFLLNGKSYLLGEHLLGFFSHHFSS